jgi:hypothetical protein
MGEMASPALPTLFRLLRHDDPLVRGAAGEALHTISISGRLAVFGDGTYQRFDNGPLAKAWLQ